MDVEGRATPNPTLRLEWEDLTFTIKSKGKNESITILDHVSGSISSGEMLAVMGPSGAGKSTFLDVLSMRTSSRFGTSSRLGARGVITLNGSSEFSMRDVSSYVEQDDALLGVLTVRETLAFSAKLSFVPGTPAAVISERVEETLEALGLSRVADNRIGTPIQRGISGGQKRRVTIGTSLVARPRILFLDEPTSGLDSATSKEVVSSIKRLAKASNIMVIATIHQPSWQTFSLFDHALLLARGRVAYSGPVSDMATYFESLGYPTSQHANPADTAIDAISTDFLDQSTDAEQHVAWLSERWSKNSAGSARPSLSEKTVTELRLYDDLHVLKHTLIKPSAFFLSMRHELRTIGLLCQRNTLNYSRNLLAYGVRLGMYVGMGVLLGTVWANNARSHDAAKIQDRLSVHFFSVAFLGFMSVAGIPAFLEERGVFLRERHNALYGPGAYSVAISITSVPFLFVCCTVFSVIAYWSIGLHVGAGHFFRFLAYLFLAVYAAEGQSLLVAAFAPIFVAALALASFINGFWMCNQGFFIRASNLPRFWYYWAHWIDYETYAFDLLVWNDMHDLTWTSPCSGSGCISQETTGRQLIDELGFGGMNVGLYVGILLIINVVYRLLFYLALVWKRK
ncbi:P-loop containing nucleoside triphosphate hydrolase protein [Punctularia strigosozonata HHB-11173 SS5]|uniref:P-loop containing nucleoside triphosphate hydrolase protein n=1 Tax=Punctularia strigosozonata (strain HHB-11173) TaxID=741275 RepID=UPI00044165C6|nr:P-loop containing nucleoside triphosphate hydrolase protein [Punctularia strigosozonata HHB-11173 SS5]EIN11024.1 P-loop containing nucleoside triphosphate hydrolase protein [Punctularia strigosozonata HHB-11173 SS5]